MGLLVVLLVLAEYKDLIFTLCSGVALILGAWSKVESSRAMSKETENEKAVEAFKTSYNQIKNDYQRVLKICEEQAKQIKTLQEHDKKKNLELEGYQGSLDQYIKSSSNLQKIVEEYREENQLLKTDMDNMRKQHRKEIDEIKNNNKLELDRKEKVILKLQSEVSTLQERLKNY